MILSSFSSTSTTAPSLNLPPSNSIESGLSTYFWIALRNGRAPNAESKPSLASQARAASGFADRLRGRFGLPVELVDERLTTREAERRMAEAGPRRRIPDLDSVAACVLLESVLMRSGSEARG